MTGPDPKAEALLATLREMRRSERHWPAMAASPRHRAHLEDGKAMLDANLADLKRIQREATAVRDALAKVLKRVKPRILA